MQREIETAEQLGEALREARKARDLRLEDVALAAGVGIRFVSELDGVEPLDLEIEPWLPDRARDEFTRRYERLEALR
jgi:transcriptional regulator with XRE-family HTH domain